MDSTQAIHYTSFPPHRGVVTKVVDLGSELGKWNRFMPCYSLQPYWLGFINISIALIRRLSGLVQNRIPLLFNIFTLEGRLAFGCHSSDFVLKAHILKQHIVIIVIIMTKGISYIVILCYVTMLKENLKRLAIKQNFIYIFTSPYDKLSYILSANTLLNAKAVRKIYR